MHSVDEITRAIQEQDKLLHNKTSANEFHYTASSDGITEDELSYNQVVSSISHSLHNDSKKRRQQRNSTASSNGGLIDPTVCHVKRGVIMMPIEMTIPNNGNIESADSSAAATPSYTMTESNVALYAAFPPPFPMNKNECVTDIDSDEYMRNQAGQRFIQYSGFYGAAGSTSATKFRQGFAETLLSLNYRFPALLPIPTPSLQRRSRQSFTDALVVGDVHSNLQFGSTSQLSLGGTLSSLDGTSHLRIDVSNPFTDTYHKTNSKRRRDMSILQLYPRRRDCTLSASRDLVVFAQPLSVHLMTKVSPATRYGRFQLGYFNFMVTSLQDATIENTSGKEAISKSKVSLCIGYGEPSPGGEALRTSQLITSSHVHSRDCGIDMRKSDLTRSGSCSGGARIALDLEQPVSPSQTCQSTIEYHHTGNALSLGTMLMRTSATSKLASIGVGIRHTFANIFNFGSQWWTNGVTSWIFQIQRGETRIVVPITIHPNAVTTWESFLRLSYASLATIVVDTLVSELLCDEISKLRLKFLSFLLGEESVMSSRALLTDRLDKIKAREEESSSLRMQLMSKAREEALRQTELMKRQAKKTVKKEEQQDGLVILNAVYGVLDNETGEWLKASTKSTSNMHMMDATTQLQFWTESSALHMSSVSKQHCLGFYDVLSCVSEEDWTKQDSSKKDATPGIIQRMKNILELRKHAEDRRDLVAVLRVRYKWAGQEFVKVFNDEDKIDLP